MGVSREKRLRVYARDGYRCGDCGMTSTPERVLELLDAARLNGGRFPRAEMLTLDHVWPRALGGTDDESNLRTLCFPCNNRKGDRPAGHPPPSATPKKKRPPDVRPRRGRLVLRGPDREFAPLGARVVGLPPVMHLAGCDPVFGCVGHCPVRGLGYPIR